jgi:hypothetical protein
MDMGSVINLVAATAGSNLPPCRAAVQDSIRQAEAKRAEIGRLRNGEQGLVETLAKAEAGRQELERAVRGDAATLVAKFRAGIEAVGAIAGFKTLNAAAKLTGTQVDHAVVEEALITVRGEIARLEAEVTDLEAARQGLILDAVRETAAGYFSDYESLVDVLRGHMVILAGLEKYLGVSRVNRTVAILPSFTRENGLDEMPVVAPAHEISAANEVWQRLGKAIAEDPAALIDGLLEFKPAEGAEDPNLSYDLRSPLERRLIDATTNFFSAS